MNSGNKFLNVYTELKKILKKFENGMNVKDEGKENYYLIGPYSEKFKKELWFASLHIKKNYVSYHLMPVYMYPELVKEIPSPLKKRMQGKSCFNFKEYDKELFQHLAKLTLSAHKMFSKRFDNI
ncbi:MAG TPA: hypothetical protein PLZ15_05125 [Melioribacteraceae bacterium]|nr:hypothetical protein [Melioribacteraceae bacterium]